MAIVAVARPRVAYRHGYSGLPHRRHTNSLPTQRRLQVLRIPGPGPNPANLAVSARRCLVDRRQSYGSVNARTEQATPYSEKKTGRACFSNRKSCLIDILDCF